MDAFLLAIQHLTRYTSPGAHPREARATPATFEVFNVASGHVITVSELVENVISLAQSKSPIRTIPSDTRFSDTPVTDVQKAQRQLGFQASINIQKGLTMTLRMYLQHFEETYSRQIAATCGTPPPTRSLNMQLEKLDGCAARIHLNNRGRLASLSAPPPDGEPFWHVDNEIIGTGLQIKASNAGGKRTIHIRGLENGLFLGVKNPASGPVSIARVTETDLKSDPNIYADWEIESNPDTHVVRLILSGTKFQLAGPKSSGRQTLRLISKNDKRSWPFRISPVCCQAPGPWPFTADDREST